MWWFFIFYVCNAFMTSWYVGRDASPVSLQYFDSIHIGDPIIYPNGTAACDKTDTFLHNITKYAHSKGVDVLWGSGINVHETLFIRPSMQDRYIQSIGKAMEQCNIDGLEFDYEWQDTNWGKLGIVTPEQSTRYTTFLSNIKKATGRIVAADVSIWGYKKGLYLLGVLPWVNVTMLNRGDIDYINTMSYHWAADGDIGAWVKDAFILHTIWGIDKKRVNIGIPYFSHNHSSEPTWGDLSKHCPDIDPNVNKCNGVLFVGKQMNYNLGRWLRREGWKGAFPWALTYDSATQSLIQWLYRGFISE